MTTNHPTPGDELVERLRGLLANATARPWRVFESRFGSDVIAIMKGNQPRRDQRGDHVRRWPEIVAWPGFDASDVPHRYRRVNAELMVEAVNALPALLDELEALRTRDEAARSSTTEVERLRTALVAAEPHVETLHSLVIGGGRSKSDAAKIVWRDLCKVRAALQAKDHSHAG